MYWHLVKYFSVDRCGATVVLLHWSRTNTQQADVIVGRVVGALRLRARLLRPGQPTSGLLQASSAAALRWDEGQVSVTGDSTSRIECNLFVFILVVAIVYSDRTVAFEWAHEGTVVMCRILVSSLLLFSMFFSLVLYSLHVLGRFSGPFVYGMQSSMIDQFRISCNIRLANRILNEFSVLIAFS